MNTSFKVSLIGGSGLVGGEVLDILSTDDKVSSVVAVTRRPLKKNSSKIKNLTIDFNDLFKDPSAFEAEVFICCLGTTIKKAGSQNAFARVDLDYVLSWAQLAKKVGAKKFMVVSAMGANENSKIFYNRVKGQMQKAITDLGIPQVEIFQPSLILGERSENRAGEDIAQALAPVMNALMIGPLKKYKAIKASDIAKAIVIKSKEFKPGIFIYQSDQIQKIADQSVKESP